MFYTAPELTITYQKWRENNNPWTDGTFQGNLNPKDTEDSNILNMIHSTIDEYFNPRYLGVQDEDRFSILFLKRLKEIEYQFFQSFESESIYYNVKEMIKNYIIINTTSGKITDSGSNTYKQENNLTTTSEKTQDAYDVTSTLSNTGTNTTKDTGTDTVENTETQNTMNTTTSKHLQSDTPQSNVSSWIQGLNNDVTWDFATQYDETLGTSTDNKNDTSSSTRTANLTTEVTLDTSQNNTTSYDDIKNHDSTSNTGTIDLTTSTSNTKSNEETHTQEGQNVITPEVLQKWKSYLFGNASSLRWLFDSLETCFVSVYD